MRTSIVVTPDFETIWPFVADQLLELLKPTADVELHRLRHGASIRDVVDDPDHIRRLIALGVEITDTDLDAFPALSEVAVSSGYGEQDGIAESLTARGISYVGQHSEGFWGQSVAEFALGLTIGALRRIPQAHHGIVAGQENVWRYEAEQYADDSRFTNGTVEGKRVRIVGAGNIGSRYASFTHFLGADVASWDPYAADPSFHRSGSRREHFLERLVRDAEIFAPMVPLTAKTHGLITAELINTLPTGCLVILATRAGIVDTAELRRRIIANELSLAADVHDLEPLPKGDDLIGRDNVVHTPHLAGRTKDANLRWAQMLVDRFSR